MKEGKTLQELAAQLQADKARMRDYAVDTRQLHVLTSAPGHTEVHLPGGVGELMPAPRFLRQLGQDLGVRADLFDRLRTKHPVQFDHLVNGLLNRWGEDHGGEAGRRLVRTYADGGPDGQGIARCVLSDRFRRIDNYDIAMAALPVIQQIPGAQVMSCDVTESKLYLKVVVTTTSVDLGDLPQRGYGIGELYGTGLKRGDVIQAGFVLVNSEVGAAALDIKQLVYRVQCLNGLIGESILRRTHIGGRLTSDDDGIVYREETLAADDLALMMKVQDAVASAVDELRFRQLAAQFAEAATGQRIERPVEAMKVLAPAAGLTEAESGNVLQHLIEGGDLSQFGLVNAITRASQDVDDYDRATELEELGGKVLLAPPVAWRDLVAA